MWKKKKCPKWKNAFIFYYDQKDVVLEKKDLDSNRS